MTRFARLQAVLAITLLLTLASAYQIALSVAQTGVSFTPRSGRWLLAGALLFLAIGMGGLLAASWSTRRPSLFESVHNLRHKLALGNRLAWGLFIFSLVLFPALVLYPLTGNLVVEIFPRLLLFWAFVLVDTFLLARALPGAGWLERFLAASLALAGIFRLSLFLPDLSTFPFSLGWSEASRYYYASLFFSEQIYGQTLHPTVLHPSRYLLQALPFLASGLPLWAHRLWQVLLWIVISLGTGALLARRFPVSGRGSRWLLIAWSALFLFQGPVYYHLLVPVMIVLAGFDSRHVWRSLLVVAAASAWAGISRVNWFPVPGLLAGTLYLLEVCVPAQGSQHGGQQIRRMAAYLLPPVLWTGIGALSALGAQMLYIRWSGNAARSFTSSFSSDLLWYRLLPNPTYPLGLLPSVLLASAPALVLFWLAFRHKSDRTQFLRPLGIGAVLLVLLAGGLIVSVKIGGGSNLHNLDAYLVILWVVAAYSVFDQIQAPEPRRAYQPARAAGNSPLVLALALLPVLFALTSGQPLRPHSSQVDQEALGVLQKWVDRAVEDGKPVLFISERQLLTFGYINAPLFADYEKVYLMEMVMSRNPDYMDEFHTDIQAQIFGMIVTDPLYDRYKDPERSSWAEENNAWVEQVAEPVMCYYKRKTSLTDVGVQILIPRDEPQGCP